MFSQRNMGAPSNEFTWLTLRNPFWRALCCLSFLGNVTCCRIFWFFYKVFLVWFGNCTAIFHAKYPRHFRPKVPCPLPHASRFRMWELKGRPLLIHCHSQTKAPETCWGRGDRRGGGGRGEGNPQPGWEAGDTSHGLWSAPGERGCLGEWENAEACWLLIKPWACGSYFPFPPSLLVPNKCLACKQLHSTNKPFPLPWGKAMERTERK